MVGTVILVLLVIAALAAAGVWYWIMEYPRHPRHHDPVYGSNPQTSIPKAHPQGTFPTLKMPTAKGWDPGTKPTAAPGLKVTAFAENLKHPRWAYVLPNGDVLVAEASTVVGTPKSLMDFATKQTMKRAGASYPSANRITLLRDTDGDGVPEVRETFLENLNQPFGMALIGDTFYVGNTDSVVAFPYAEGQTKITAASRKLTDVKPGGHWTRNIIPSLDNTKLRIAVGSLSNIADEGFEAEVDRACILELDLATGARRTFAGGLRNPVGMAYEPTTGDLWTVVNERDGLGDETPPDYLTSVKDGAFYGWPYSYWGVVDDRVQPQNAALVASQANPDFALGGHTASLGLCWMPEGTLPGHPAGMVIGQHGSWNRSKLSGYRVVLVPFANGKPTGQPPIDLLTGFLAPDEKHSNGRPVGVAIAKDGALLVVDDVGHNVWRVTGA